MKKALAAVFIGLLLGVLSLPALAQREVEPNDLKVSPVRFRNASIVVRDSYFDRRSGIPPALTASGYTLDKYIAFGLREAGMWCFLRRTSENEKLVSGLHNGQTITVRGTVRQAKAKVERGRFANTHKLDIYLLEASRVETGGE